jgi:hypothetical protein
MSDFQAVLGYLSASVGLIAFAVTALYTIKRKYNIYNTTLDKRYNVGLKELSLKELNINSNDDDETQNMQILREFELAIIQLKKDIEELEKRITIFEQVEHTLPKDNE